MPTQQFKAVYSKRDGKYIGFVMEFLSETSVSGRTLAEVKAKLRAALPEAIRKDRQNKIRGKDCIEETISVEIKP